MTGIPYPIKHLQESTTPLNRRKGPLGPCYNRNHISPPPPPSPPPPSPPNHFIPIRSRNNDMIPLIYENSILIPSYKGNHFHLK